MRLPRLISQSRSSRKWRQRSAYLRRNSQPPTQKTGLIRINLIKIALRNSVLLKQLIREGTNVTVERRT